MDGRRELQPLLLSKLRGSGGSGGGDSGGSGSGGGGNDGGVAESSHFMDGQTNPTLRHGVCTDKTKLIWQRKNNSRNLT